MHERSSPLRTGKRSAHYLNPKAKSGLGIFLALILFPAFSGPGRQVKWKGTIEKEDGVTVVRNPKDPIHSEDVFSVEEELCIGKAEGRDEYTFSRLWYLAVDDQENIYALDQGETRVKVFDKKGVFLRAIGEKGEGPGELLHPNNIFITDRNQLVIEDFIRNLTYYSLDGQFLKAQTTAKIFPVGILMDSWSRVFALININKPEKSGKEIVLFDENLGYQKTIISFPRPKPNPQVLELFQPDINWALSNDNNLVISSEEDYELKIFNAQGGLVRKILKEYEPVRITEEDVKQRVRKVPEGRKLVIPKYFPSIHSLIADDEGRVFVHTYEKSGEGEYVNDVFDSEGRYITKISLKDCLQVWKKKKLYSIEEDREGFQVIKRYKTIWDIK